VGRQRMNAGDEKGYMVDGCHIPIRNRTKKPLAIASSGKGRGLRGREDGGNVNNV
jgi:hypothetical protein